jgi:hypothetical protein
VERRGPSKGLSSRTSRRLRLAPTIFHVDSARNGRRRSSRWPGELRKPRLGRCCEPLVLSPLRDCQVWGSRQSNDGRLRPREARPMLVSFMTTHELTIKPANFVACRLLLGIDSIGPTRPIESASRRRGGAHARSAPRACGSDAQCTVYGTITQFCEARMTSER